MAVSQNAECAEFKWIIISFVFIIYFFFLFLGEVGVREICLADAQSGLSATIKITNCSAKAVDPVETLRLLSGGDKSEVIRDKRSAKRRQRLVTVKNRITR